MSVATWSVTRPGDDADRERRPAPVVDGFYEPVTGSIQYVAACPATGGCAVIDPVLDIDDASGAVSTRSADAILDHVDRRGYRVEWILDTHPHADHLSAAQHLKAATGAPIAIGARVTQVQSLWKDIYNLPDLRTDGSQWDRLLEDGDTFRIGDIEARALFSPGHTLASVTYMLGDAAFIHDTLFMPDSGTARCDFPGGSAPRLWETIEKILAMPDDTRLFTGHDYRPGGREARWESSVREQKLLNPHVAGRTREEFVTLREERDRSLPMPKLMLLALQVNIQAGRLPAPEAGGRRYLKFPLDALSGARGG